MKKWGILLHRIITATDNRQSDWVILQKWPNNLFAFFLFPLSNSASVSSSVQDPSWEKLNELVPVRHLERDTAQNKHQVLAIITTNAFYLLGECPSSGVLALNHSRGPCSLRVHVPELVTGIPGRPKEEQSHC